MTGEAKLLQWLARASPVLESQIVGSSLSKALNALLRQGYAEMIGHPTVKERSGIPAAAASITEKGRKIAAQD